MTKILPDTPASLRGTESIERVRTMPGLFVTALSAVKSDGFTVLYICPKRIERYGSKKHEEHEQRR